MLGFCLWNHLSGDSNDRQLLLSWSPEHDTCMAECIWMEVISLPLFPLSIAFCCCHWLSVFCCRDDHGCHQRRQMKGCLYPHPCLSILTLLPLTLPVPVISYPCPHLNNEHSQPPVLTECSFILKNCLTSWNYKIIYSLLEFMY